MEYKAGERMLGMGPVELFLLAEEFAAEAVRFVGAPVGMAEGEVEIVVARPDQQTLLVLSSSTGSKSDRDGVETDEVCSLGLGKRLHPQLPAYDRDLL